MRNLWLFALVVMAGLAVPDCAPAGDTEPGFTRLFNGKDLTGWVYKGSKEDLTGKTETADQRFTVENGAITTTCDRIRAVSTAVHGSLTRAILFLSVPILHHGRQTKHYRLARLLDEIDQDLDDFRKKRAAPT